MRRTIQNCLEDQGGGVSAKRQSARCHLIQHGSKREEVRACIQLFSFRLLRRHVCNGPDGRAWTREELIIDRASLLVIVDAALARRARGGCNLREPKIQNLRVPPSGHEDIRRLDVTVNDSFGVRRIQRIGDLDAE